MNIIDTLDDQQLFRPHFRGGAKSWAAWRVFLAALFGLEMTADQVEVYRHHTGRQTPPITQFTEATLVCGRRGGKSRILALIAVYLACFRDYSKYLAPGEVATIAIIASDRKQARTILRYIVGLLKETKLLSPMIADEGAESISLRNRVVIEIATASFRVTRGYTFAACLADETAFWRDDTSANPDHEIVRALKPGLSSIPGSMLLIASSPYRKAGVLYESFRKHFGQDDSKVIVWKAPTREMNPHISQAIIDEAYEADPAVAAAEYGAEFRSDIDSFVSREIVDGCTLRGRSELPPISGVSYMGFVDPSGGSNDSMTLGIAHRDGNMSILDCVREIRPPFSPEAVVIEFANVLRSYNVSKIYGDRYAAEWPRERFRFSIISYEVADKPKSDIYGSVLPMFNSGRVELLDIPRLALQLVGLERRTGRSGKDSINHAPNAHDDVANAACGALLLTTGHGTSYDVTLNWCDDLAELYV